MARMYIGTLSSGLSFLEYERTPLGDVISKYRDSNAIASSSTDGPGAIPASITTTGRWRTNAVDVILGRFTSVDGVGTTLLHHLLGDIYCNISWWSTGVNNSARSFTFAGKYYIYRATGVYAQFVGSSGSIKNGVGIWSASYFNDPTSLSFNYSFQGQMSTSAQQLPSA